MKVRLTYLLLILSLHSFGKTYYVNKAAIGSNNGASWSNALTNLRWALEVARSGDSIKVAAGSYFPSGIAGNDSTFTLARGVILLGGYPDTGSPSDVQRDWVNQPTILSNNGFSALLVSAVNLDTATVVDGFLLTGGYGGMQIENCSRLSISNTIFQANHNGAVTIDKSQVFFSNCVFDRNSGGNATIDQTGSANSIFYNCIVSGNQSSSGIYIIHNQDASISLINCSIVNNAGVALYGGGSGIATIRNSIFWNNITHYTTEASDIVPGSQLLVIANCLTQTYYQDGINSLLVNYNPRFYNIGNPAGADNKWFTADDGLQLTAPCSPALNAGDNSVVAASNTDLLGRPRIFGGGTVDLGAYEWQSTPGSPLTTVFVNQSATGTGNGSSWINAFTTLQQALLYCADTIKMAQGTYLTDNSFVDSVFFLQNKTVILGGYPATGNPLETQRDPAQYQTLLKGNYQRATSGLTYPVLVNFHGDTTTLIDGLTFDNETTSGGGSVPSLYIGYESRLRVARCHFLVVNNNNLGGGGILISQYSSPSIIHSTFSTDRSDFSGGAITCRSHAAPVIRFCQFTGNTNAGPTFRGTGYAIDFDQSSGIVDSCVFSRYSYNASPSMVNLSSSNLHFTNTVFRASSTGGYLLSNYNNSNSIIDNCLFMNKGSVAVYNDNSSPVFDKCLFDSNSISIVDVDHAAPVFNNCISVNGIFLQNTKSSPSVNNCTIVNTFGYSSVPGPAESELVTNSDSSTLRASNTIFWGNKLASGHKDICDASAGGNVQSSASILTNCITRGYGQDGVNGNRVGLDPRFFRLTDIYGPDHLLFTPDDGIRLAKCSPAINAGNNGLGILFATDILGAPRIVNGAVDIGAYEYQQSPATSNSLYVNANAGGNNTGSSWQDAYTDLQTAVCDVCSDTIRVAAGTYKPAVSSRDSSFDFQRRITLYGGYPANGPASEALRDPFTNLTVLSGNIGNPADSGDNSKTIVNIESVPDSIIVDGFVIRDGNSKISGGGGLGSGNPGGAGMRIYNSKAIIRNCQFLHNRSSFYGGAVNVGYLDSCVITHTLFSDNCASNAGGAISQTGGYLTLNGCIFDRNYAYGQGGALQLYNFFHVENCLFYKNYTTATNTSGKGGAIDASLGGGVIYNCTLVGNSAAAMTTAGGGGIFYNQSLSVPVVNCIFKDNTTGGSSAALGADIDWGDYTTLFNSLLQANRPYSGNSNRYGVDPAFIDESNPLGKDGKWFTADDGLQLTYGSPAVDYGNNTAVAGLTNDLAGGNRITGPAVDAGAYEFQDQPLALAGKDTLICSGDSIRVGRPGDPAFTYQWTSNPAGFVSADPIAPVRPTVATSYYLLVTDGNTTSRDTVDIATTGSLIPAITIYTDTTAICKGAAAIFKAVSVNGGDSAVYQWQVNDTITGTNSNQLASSTLADGSKVMAVLKSSLSCANPRAATSNPITMKVSPVGYPAFTIIAPTDPICIMTNVTLRVTPVNGGDHPSFTWYNGGNTYQITADTLVTYFTDTLTSVSAMMTSSDGCASPRTVTNGINIRASLPVPLSVTMVASRTQVCTGEEVQFIATPVNGGNAPSFQWLVNGTNAGDGSNTYNSNTLSNGDRVSVQLSGNGACVSPLTATSDPVPITVSTNYTPVITISSLAPPVPGQPVLLTASIANGGSTPGYQWQDSTSFHGWTNLATAAATTASLSYNPPTAGADVRCLLSSTLECVTARTVASAPLIFAAINPTASSDSGSGVRLYPNPVQSTLFVDSLKSSDGWETIEIRSLSGQQKVISVNATGLTQVTINVSALPKGMYLVCLLRRTGANIYRKILKM